jgi:hypothetical protein
LSTDVSEKHIASIFRVEKLEVQQTSVKAGGKPNVTKPATCFHVGFLLSLFFRP